MLLYWTVISEAITKGAKVFDFGRSTLNEGTYNFKKQWGSQPAPLHWASYINGVQQDVLDISKSKPREFVEHIWRKLPLAFVNFVGPRVRKFVSLLVCDCKLVMASYDLNRVKIFRLLF